MQRKYGLLSLVEMHEFAKNEIGTWDARWDETGCTARPRKSSLAREILADGLAL